MSIDTRVITLKKGEFLFREGEPPRSMYLVTRGMIRVFKVKGDQSIDLDTMRTGQLVGELGVLDGNVRSAHAEALVDSDLIEISSATVEKTIATFPEWMKALVKTIVTRIRHTTNRVKQLEQASTQYETDQYGNRSKTFVYVNTAELLRFCVALSLVAGRFGSEKAGKYTFKEETLFRFAHQVLQLGEAKVISMIECMKTTGLLQHGEAGYQIMMDLPQLDRFILFQNEQNLLEVEKQRKLSDRGLYILSLAIAKLDTFTADSSGVVSVNFAAIKAAEKAAYGRDPFQDNELEELSKAGFFNAIEVISGTEVVGKIQKDKLKTEFRHFLLLSEISKLNEKKRKSGSGA